MEGKKRKKLQLELFIDFQVPNCLLPGLRLPQLIRALLQLPCDHSDGSESHPSHPPAGAWTPKTPTRHRRITPEPSMNPP